MSTRAIQITELRLGIGKNGLPLDGGYVRFKLSGSETLATVYQDKEKSLEADNPIQLDDQGRALVYADGELKLEIFAGNPATYPVLWTWDTQKYRAPNARVSTKTANYEITPDDDMVLGDASSVALTFSLQQSAKYVAPVFIKKIDSSANNITVTPYSGETIDGGTSVSLTDQNETLHIFPDGSDWWSVKLTSIPTADNADTVDNIHAAATAQPNKLLALDANSEFPLAVTSGVPAGVVVDWAGSTAPSGWFLCYGQEVSRTTYADLFSAIGTTYGVGDGSTTFNLPDCRGRVSAGKDDMGGTSANRLTGQSGGVDGDVLGGTGGAETHTLITSEMPTHTHPIYKSNTDLGSGKVEDGANVSGATGYTGSAGGDQAHNNVQPTIIFNKIIKY